MRDHLHIHEIAFGIECHQQIDGRTGKAGQRDEINRFVDVADQLDRRHLLLEDGPDRKFGVFVAHNIRRGKFLRQGRFRHYAGLRTLQGR